MQALSSRGLTRLAHEAGFELVGFARPEPIARAVLVDWLAQGFHADMDWMSARLEERLDVQRLFPGTQTVMVLASNYWHSDEPSPVARYARGRDYHATFKDRFRRLRRALREGFSEVRVYTAVDSSPVMEKVWAVRAGLGVVGKNGCLITRRFGSWVLLGVILLDASVDSYWESRVEDVCGDCRLCIDSCPTGAIAAPQTVDARACLSYQTIENEGLVPVGLRSAMKNTVFGCDVCQDVCPENAGPILGGQRFAPRSISTLSVRALAGMTPLEYQQWVPGSPLARAGYDGLRRNAAYALGAARDEGARPLLERLCADADASAFVREAAQWALAQLSSSRADV